MTNYDLSNNLVEEVGLVYLEAIGVLTKLMGSKIFLEPLGLHAVSDRANAMLLSGATVYLENGQKKVISLESLSSLKYLTDWLLFESLEELAKYKAIKECLEEVLTCLYYDKALTIFTEEQLSDTKDKVAKIIEKARVI
jgi:hypothetical protein